MPDRRRWTRNAAARAFLGTRPPDFPATGGQSSRSQVEACKNRFHPAGQHTIGIDRLEAQTGGRHEQGNAAHGYQTLPPTFKSLPGLPDDTRKYVRTDPTRESGSNKGHAQAAVFSVIDDSMQDTDTSSGRASRLPWGYYRRQRLQDNPLNNPVQPFSETRPPC